MRKRFYKCCIAILLPVILLFVGCSKKNALVGTWTIQDGTFSLQAMLDDAYAAGPGRGTIEFKADGNYILTDKWGYIATGEYTIVSDSLLSLDFQGTANPYTFSVSNGELALIYEDWGDYTSLWIRN